MDPKELQRLKRERKRKDTAFRDTARRLHHNHMEPRDLSQAFINVAEDAPVSVGTNPGAWVEAWIWIPDSMVGQEVSSVPTEAPKDA